MWYLIEQYSPTLQPRYWLGGPSGGGRSIGRKLVDIRLTQTSVSRSHAKLTIVKSPFYSPLSLSARHVHHSTSVCVQDSSAYGTFLKYPRGHVVNRGEENGVDSHHRRLDKDTPVDVMEGALLAFGAPSAWWRLAWERVYLVLGSLNEVEKERMRTIAGLTSVEIGETWGGGTTHLVVKECCTGSVKFMMALCEGNYVVTPAWVEALKHTVVECCRNITDAANADAAMAACTLADERLFIPPFAETDLNLFGLDVLGAVFEEDVQERRKALFKGITFAFGREERRSRWAAVVELLGGEAVLARGIGRADKIGKRIVYVQGEYGSGRRVYEDPPGRAYVPETTLTEAIIKADLAPLDDAKKIDSNVAEIIDVATPGPLDSESEVDTDEENEAVVIKGKEEGGDGRASSEGLEIASARNASDLVEVEDLPKGGAAPVAGSKKRVRVGSIEKGAEEHQRKKRNLDDLVSGVTELANGTVEEEVSVLVPKEEYVIDNSDVNHREFFKVEDGVSLDKRVKAKDGKDGGVRAGKGKKGAKRADVRRFRRRKLPSASVIPLKRVRCVDSLESGYERGTLPVHCTAEAAEAKRIHSEYSEGE